MLEIDTLRVLTAINFIRDRESILLFLSPNIKIRIAKIKGSIDISVTEIYTNKVAGISYAVDRVTQERLTDVLAKFVHEVDRKGV